MFPRFSWRALATALLLAPLPQAWGQGGGPIEASEFAEESAVLDEESQGELETESGDGAEALEMSGYDPEFSPVPSLKVDLHGATSYIHDSNTAQIPNGPSASLFAFAYGANVKSRDETVQGGYYGIDYKGQYFLYEDAASAFGRDPFEHFFGAFGGVNGSKTRIRLDTDYHRNNGNAFQWDRVQRETRRARSHDYGFDLGISRDFYRGSLEFGTGFSIRDFDPGSGLSDGENTYGDVAWMTTPSFAPKSDAGLGVRFGNDSYDGRTDQEFISPSVRWRWRVSGKTSLHNTLGYETRSLSTPGAGDEGNVVYNGGLEWAATAKSAVGLGYYRQVQPSYLPNGGDSTTTGAALVVTNQLPGRFLLSSKLGLENAAYFAATGGAAAALSSRDDQFVRLAFDLSHPLKITEKVLGEWGIFYQYNENDSSLAPFSFDQSVAGIRFGLIY